MVAIDASHEANGCPELGWRRWQKKEGWIPVATVQGSGDGDCAGGADRQFDWEAMGPYDALPMERGDVLIYDNYMPHRSGKNTTADWRRALFGIYYAEGSAPGRDLRQEYYQREAEGRRKAGSVMVNGKANQFHMGEAVLQPYPVSQ